ncbi:hypothetical protein [Sneathiella chinensis]|uniref:Uncharacterized protein n=1 Tax=Sneathiella chinensis TaxID=349750 RepID=A0ABQ5U1Q8_9PROT|nr:hypothetical protein [Sneathiella chinensis]GLQ05768.1 hypothetical protein GCM10007924_09890 [Sneathiella chinensis]
MERNKDGLLENVRDEIGVTLRQMRQIDKGLSRSLTEAIMKPDLEGEMRGKKAAEYAVTLLSRKEEAELQLAARKAARGTRGEGIFKAIKSWFGR